MKPQRLLLTAGFDRALSVVALGELLTREGHQVVGVLVVSPYSLKRLRRLIRQRGRGILLQSARRLLGMGGGGGGTDPLAEFLDAESIPERSLRTWARRRQVDYQVVPTLNGERAIAFLQASRIDGVLYGGGGILRSVFLKAAEGRVLNAHMGPLPEIRGMNACEWALLLGLPPSVTIHVIDRGIDTGGILESIPVSVEPGDTIEMLRARATVLGVQGLVRGAQRLAQPLPTRSANPAPGRQCFVLAPVLRELLEFRLARDAPAERSAFPR